MPNTLSLIDQGRLQYLEELRLLTEGALSAVTMCLSDSTTTKSGCLEILEMWRLKMSSLHAKRITTLENVENLTGQPLPPPGK